MNLMFFMVKNKLFIDDKICEYRKRRDLKTTDKYKFTQIKNLSSSALIRGSKKNLGLKYLRNTQIAEQSSAFPENVCVSRIRV